MLLDEYVRQQYVRSAKVLYLYELEPIKLSQQMKDQITVASLRLVHASGGSDPASRWFARPINYLARTWLLPLPHVQLNLLSCKPDQLIIIWKS